MSTLGGNRGDSKNAKPKFQQLDINSLYRSSHGETSEPATQKNAVPRKHGMQSLGKVPSARRPPANLPSLKAETSTPTNASTPSGDQQQQTTNPSSASWAESGTPNASANHTAPSSQLNISGASSHHSQTSSSGGTSWSAVAGNVKEESSLQPPLYQSPQFQNEFPSLDGTVTHANAIGTGQKQQQNSNSHDSADHMNLRPSTDQASWMQQQQSNSGNARGGGGENGSQLSYQQPDVVPQKFAALLPSFMRGSSSNATSHSTSSSSQHQHSQSSNQMNQNSGGGGGGNYQNQARSGRGYGSYNNDYSNGPPRHRQGPPPRHNQQRHSNDDRGSSYEPDVIIQRPIIKEEELERIDSLARDDGWSKHDEIDYNKKLQFSDDEPDDDKPKDDKKMDARREAEKKSLNGPHSVDPAFMDRVRKRREEEERMDHERKLAAQRKLQELEEKAKKSSPSMEKEKERDDKGGDYDKKSEQRGSMDYGKKFNVGDKYGNDSYDNYGRGGPANDFKKSSYQSNLPPRFQKQQHYDRNDDRREKPGPPGYKPLHQQDSKNVPFSQQSSYDQRWNYNKQNQQVPSTRRNISLSQSSSDDNRRDNGKGYPRHRRESEEDDYRFSKEPVKKTIQAQITRSMSDSSDKLSDHNRSDKSASREYLGTNVCWAEVCENDKRTIDTKSRRVSESSAMSDDQPRTILQRNKPLHDHKDSKKESKESTDGEKKSVLSENLPKGEAGDDKKSLEKLAVESADQKKSLESIPEKDQGVDKSDKESSKISPTKDTDENRHKKSNPRPNYDRDPRSGPPPQRGGYNYRGANNWQGGRRGGSHQRGGRYDYSDSENSEDYDQEWNRSGSSKGSQGGRKDINRRDGIGFNSNAPKEGFQPRGEPSRRGRGGVVGSQTSGFRRSGAITAPVKNRIDNYGPPSSKSPFGSNDEKSSSEKRDNVKEKSSDDDRTKQKQKALSDGLMNKTQKESTNVAMKASSPAKPDESAKQHSTEPLALSLGDQKEKNISETGDDKAAGDVKSAMGQRTASSSSFNSNQSRQKAPITSAPPPGKPGSKPSIQSSNIVPGGKPSSAPYPNAMNKPLDTRHQMSRNDPRSMDSRNPNNNSRTAPRFTKQRDNVQGPGQGPTNMNRMTGSYWDKNVSEQMHSVNDDKMPMMQMNTSPSSIQSNNLLNTKTDAMKQQNQQPQPQSMTQQQQQPMLDGANLKTTLIFENTSYKTGPPAGIKRPQGPPPMGQQQKPQENTINTINDMIDQQAKEQSLSSALQNLSFGQKNQNDMVDMNFSYNFNADIGLLTDDRSKSGFGVVSSGSNTNVHPSQAVSKTSSLGLVGAKTGMQQNSNILNTDALNMKVASCKKVWEEPSSMEHGGSGGADDVMSNFVAQQQHLHHYGQNNMSAHGLSPGPQSYGGYGTGSGNDHSSSLEHFNKSNDADDGSSYPSPGQQQHMVHSQNQANMNMKAAEAFGTTANVCKVKPTQQQMHQAGLSPPPQMQQSQLQQQQQQTYYSTPSYQNMSTIPSPPAVVYNNQAASGGLYNPYNLDAARAAQMYGFQTGGAANTSMSFNAFMQTPNIASAPTHEMYQNLSQYRAAVQPFNQTAQLNNPNAAVLISSATPSNSMMSSKSNSQIGAIGSKSSQSAGPAASNQYGQQYLNHMYHQHQNSYYTNSTAQQANPYYSGPTATGGAATGNYGMFASHGTNVSNGPPPQQQQMANFGSVGQYPIGSQMLNNLVINQQYRNGPVVNAGNNGNGSASGTTSNAPPSGYMKQQQHQSQLQDPKLSSPSNASSEMNSSHKMYNNQNWDSSSSSGSNNYNRAYGSGQNSGMQSQSQRWPTPGPIQRPSNNNGFNAGSHHQNYQQQRSMRANPAAGNVHSSGMSMPQGKSQYFNAGPKIKPDSDKSKSQSSPTKEPGDAKIE